LGRDEVRAFERYRELIVEWNSRVNLVSRRRGDVVKSFIDSLLLVPCLPIPYGAKVIDIGSGAGFPGVPLKIVRPDVELTLVDSNRRKVLFLKVLSEYIELKADIVYDRVENLGGDPRHVGSYDLVLARGVGTVVRTAGLALPFLRGGGALVTYKGRALRPELGEFRASPLSGMFSSPQVISLSERGGRGHLVVIRRGGGS